MPTSVSPARPRRVEAVVFDWAGTTVDHGCFAPIVALIEGFRRRDVMVSVEEARKPMGLHKRDHIRTLCEMPEVAERWREAKGRLPSEADVEAIFSDFLPLQCEVVADYADLIPGCLDTMDFLRSEGVAIGSSTGYPRQVMDVLAPIAAELGYKPDATVCATDVAAGRPAPWMCFRNAEALGVYPMDRAVKVGDTVTDIQAGRHAGMWSVGVVRTGNALGLSLEELAMAEEQHLASQLSGARRAFSDAGAHAVIDGIADLPAVIEAINERLADGDQP